MDWLISANSERYNIELSFSDFGFIDWTQGSIGYNKGDIAYIYIAAPEKRIVYKCIVTQVEMDQSQIRQDKEYWFKESDYYNSLKGRFIRLSLIEAVNTENLHLYELRKHGLVNAPYVAMKLHGELLHYIESYFSAPKPINILLDSIDDAEMESSNLDRSMRLKRINQANPRPNLVQVTSYVYERNPDIVAEALCRASGVCERCNNKAPFNRKTDNSPYLEIHHIQPLSEGGVDSLENVLALCPNCHRELHFGKV